MPCPISGGRVLGRGRWGDVLTVSAEQATTIDQNTVMARITGATVEIFVASASSSRSHTVSSAQFLEFLYRNRAHLIAKLFTSSSDRVRREGFLRELRVNARVCDIYKAQASRFTALAKLDLSHLFGKEHKVSGSRGVAGVVIKKDGKSDYFVLGKRCDSELSQVHAYVGMTDALVRQVLASLQVLHGAGMLHADIHESNIMMCDSRFKLVDWEKCVSVKSLMKKIGRRNGSSIESIRSPLFALATPIIARLVHSRKLASIAALSVVTAWSSLRLTKIVLRCQYMRMALRGIAKSFVSFVSAAPEPFSPSRVLSDNVCSVDLFALGIVLFSALCRPDGGESPGQLRRVHALAVRLTHYGHPEFVGDSATRALRMYSNWK